MKAMILAAGRGYRLRPISDEIPKALVSVAGKPLIERHVEKLVAAGINEIVINISYLGEQIQNYLGNGDKYHCKIIYSDESEGALGTAGGIYKALEWLDEESFIVVNADVLSDFDYEDLKLPAESMAHLIMVDNPYDNPHGDFSLNDNKISQDGDDKLTFSGMAVYRRELFTKFAVDKRRLIDVFTTAMAQQSLVSGEQYFGQWFGINDEKCWQEAEACWQD